MSIETIAEAFDATVEFAVENRGLAVTGAGVLVAALLFAGYLIKRYAKNKPKGEALGRFCDSAAVLVAVALSAEGMWEVATEKMHFGPEKALLLFAFAELAMLRAARRARAKVDAGKRPGIYGTMVWSIALGAGLIAALNAPSPSEFVVRLLAPALVAGQWFADLIDELREKDGVEHQVSSWIWTPRRIMIRLGWVRPGKTDDLNEVLRQRNIERMVRTARRLLASKPARARRLAAKLQRLGEAMDEASMAAVVDRYQRGERVQETLFGRRLVEVPDKLSGHADKIADKAPDKIADSLSGSTDSDADSGQDSQDKGADSARGQAPDNVSSQVNKGADSGQDDLVPFARGIVLDLSGQGRPVNRTNLGHELRTKGVRIGGDKLAAVWRAVQDSPDSGQDKKVNGHSHDLAGTK